MDASVMADFPFTADYYSHGTLDFIGIIFVIHGKIDGMSMKNVGEVKTVVIGSQQYTRKDDNRKSDVFANAIRHDHKSPKPTTRWSDIMKLK